MKKLTCEMCGSTDLVKQEGVFVCQSCGSKFSVEEAKRMMVEVEGTLEVAGKVTVDNRAKLDNLYKLARRAIDGGNIEKAAQYYEQILLEDPNNWEPAFYSAYFSAVQKYKNGRSAIENAVGLVGGCLDSVFELIEKIQNINERDTAFNEVENLVSVFLDRMYEEMNTEHKNKEPAAMRAAVASKAGMKVLEAHYELKGLRTLSIGEVHEKLADKREELYSSPESNNLAVARWKKAIDLCGYGYGSCTPELKEAGNKFYERCKQKIRKYEPSYGVAVPSSGGCYIATAVYGSYNCPQVWTLRRYRDNVLAETWIGRMFIRTYYAISPAIVKCFGKTKLFNKFWKVLLDKLVKRLEKTGVESTPYHLR